MINSIRLQNYRSYSDESFEFDPGVNIVVGPNASGKTNLLEAVLVLCRGNSYRAKDAELIKFDQPWLRLDGNFVSQERSLKLEKTHNLVDKNYLLDDKPYKRLSLEKTVPVVYFEPNHLQIITRGPEQRRAYFDELLERSSPGFKAANNNYKRVLAQRNSLLKQGAASAGRQIFAWNIRLSELGEKIAQARQQLSDDINQTLSATYKSISKQKAPLRLEYNSQFAPANYANRLLHRLEKTAETDYQRGFTGHGPHREDFSVWLNDQYASVSASRGENRSIMLALKIYELNLIERVRQQPPIFLLDDVFSELDGARRQALVSFLNDRQTIITTTDADSVIEHFTEAARLLPLVNPKRS
jgi:DNA replication and repair protein RecF